MASSPNIFVFVGSDHMQVREAASRKVGELTPPDAGDLGCDVIDGVADNADSAYSICSKTIEALQTLPFFGGKVVWLKGATFFGTDVTSGAKATIEGTTNLIEVIAEGLGDDVTFVLSATGMNKVRTFYKQLSKLAKIEVFDKVDTKRDGWEEIVMAEVSRRAKARNLSFGPGALNAFVMRAGEDTGQAESELEKLSLYLGDGGVVQEAHVWEMVSPTREGVVFEIGDAIARRNLPQALTLVKDLLRQGQSGVGILLAAIVPKVRNLFWARVMSSMVSPNATSNYSSFQRALASLPDQQTAHLPRTKKGDISAYPLFLSMGAAKAYSGKHLRQSLSACLTANRQLVTTQLDPEVVLTRLLVEILSPSSTA